ncbi:hypothetical protein [Undibacter mobilis]|uniref:Uncharacterized protein n=1 Tax=Undibacter mobilis TaxID=2292256 RepID=A0A371B7P3_9BRAD|nr:hypothetical protein [Undibacter mobilis]RDV03635.1 hypothetical protein DXH78_02955 [Undibacter mobilis]
MRTAFRALAISVALGAGTVFAQEPLKEPPKEPPSAEAPKDLMPHGAGRFSFAPAEGGYLRLDSATGQVSFCSLGSAGWTCQLAPDDRAALDAEIARLQSEIEKLKSGTANAEPPRPKAELTPRSGNDDSRLRFPTRDEMERARAAVERAWRHFVDMVYDFQKDVMKKD